MLTKTPAHALRDGNRIKTRDGIERVVEVVFNLSADKWKDGVELELENKRGRRRIIAVGWDTMISRVERVE